jgi:hypothetical protein
VLLALLAFVLCAYLVITAAKSAYVAVKPFSTTNYALRTPSIGHSGRNHGETTSQQIGIVPNPCRYHAPILDGDHRPLRAELLSMERFLEEGGSQANALFTRADNWRSSLDKGCMCEIASGVLSISADD